MKYKLLVSAFFTVLLLASAAHADLIINGGFEDPALRYGTWNAGYTSISGWTATFGTIEIQNHAAGNPYEGNQLCELDSYYNSGMKQDVATVAGQTYDLNFAYSPRPNNVATSNYIEIYFDGALLASITGYSSPNTDWGIHNYTVTATGTTSTIEFRAAGGSDSLGGYLDAVTFNRAANVPEPASLLLLGAGLAGVGLLRKKVKS